MPRRKRSSKKKLQKTLKAIGLIALTLALTVLVYLGEQAGIWFKASVLEAPQPFNGTVMPVSKVPDWVHWGGDAGTHYDSVAPEHLIDLPPYDLEEMSFPNDQLIWGNHEHNDIRNTKITYSVVYMGNYQLDHKENAGSHLAVDIKMPVGTPIHSIANGKVTKVSMVETGFGHHVVVKHPNVPDPHNPGKLTTLYSGFNHMSEIHVVEGQNVLKGEVIGKSGNTGTSTTPHLHFQIDRETAGWHPYWPFSWSEAQDAGLSFFEAVNAGLGVAKGRQHTVHPMEFVVNNLNTNSVAGNGNSGPVNPDNSSSETEGNDTEAETENPEPPIEVDPDPTPEPEPEPVVETDPTENLVFKITGESAGLINNGVTLNVVDESNQLALIGADDDIRIYLEGVGEIVTAKKVSKEDFNNNSLKVVVKSTEKGSSTIQIGQSKFSINFIDGIKALSQFKVHHDGYYQKNVVEHVEVIGMDQDGNLTATANFPGTVKIKVVDGSATVIPEELTQQDFRNGVAKIKVIVKNTDPVQIQAKVGALVGLSEPIRNENERLFADISRSHPNFEAIQYLKEKEIISGYSDGTYQPNKTVNRVEALKMLMLAFNVSVGAGEALSFNDTDNSAWYAGTLATAVARGIVGGYNDGSFRPANTVNKAEYLKMLFATNDIEENGVITEKPYSDVDTSAWFASYAFLAKSMNLVETSGGYLFPQKGMTRAEVAETIYRLKMIQKNNWVAYVK